MRSFRLSLVILLEVFVIIVIGLILRPAINRAIKNKIIRIIGNAIKRVSLKFSKINIASSSDIATKRYPTFLSLSKSGI